MDIAKGALVLTLGRDAAAVGEAAAIWARAKARRDQDPLPATTAETLPGLKRRLKLDGADLLLAKQGDVGVGFTLFAPREESLEIFYLAVDPESWGRGVAGSLLAGAEDRARNKGLPALELWVIKNNDRAIGVYGTFGFFDTGQTKRVSGRTERRLFKPIS